VLLASELALFDTVWMEAPSAPWWRGLFEADAWLWAALVSWRSWPISGSLPWHLPENQGCARQVLRFPAMAVIEERSAHLIT